MCLCVWEYSTCDPSVPTVSRLCLCVYVIMFLHVRVFYEYVCMFVDMCLLSADCEPIVFMCLCVYMFVCLWICASSVSTASQLCLPYVFVCLQVCEYVCVFVTMCLLSAHCKPIVFVCLHVCVFTCLCVCDYVPPQCPLRADRADPVPPVPVPRS